MKREIKFRAWNKLERRWEEKLCLYLDDSKIGDVSECFHNEDDAEAYEIEQYTGLKDKNGVGIYEGDIVKIINHRHILANGLKEADAQYLVVWNGLGFDFKILNGDFMQGCGRNSESEYEVIGNIHEGIFKDNVALSRRSLPPLTAVHGSLSYFSRRSPSTYWCINPEINA